MIRPAIYSDIPGMVELGLQVLAESVYKTEPNTIKTSHAFLKAIDDPNTFCLLAIDDNQVVGILILNSMTHWFSNDRVAYDSLFIVKPSYKHQAPYLIKRAVSWVKARPSIVQIHLGITSGIADLKRTTKLYTRLGFSVVGANFIKHMGVTPHE